MIGTITRVYGTQGYAFVTMAARRVDAFLHRRSWRGPTWPPAVGQLVRFELMEGPRGPRAEEASPIEVDVDAIA